MTAKTSRSLTGVTIALSLLGVTSLPAQEFSPYLQRTGKGAYDLYKDALICVVVLAQEIQAAPDSAQCPNLETAIGNARSLALLLLESGNVVDLTGAILMRDNLVADQQKADSDWQARLETQGEDTGPEVDRCWRLYGHDVD